MSIPLVQNNEKDSINTSIIAIKRNIERINMLLGLSNSEEIDTSKFATKDELQQAVTDLQPVDEVAVDNMHSVTSNAVYEKLGNTTSWETLITGVRYKIRNGLCTVKVDLSNASFNSNGVADITTLPEKARPSVQLNFPACVYGLSGTGTYNETQTWLRIASSGEIKFVGGIVNKTTGECHTCVTYTL